MDPVRPLKSYISVKRLEEIKVSMLCQGFKEAQVDIVEAIICQALNFDPNDKRLLQYKREKIREKAKRLGSASSQVTINIQGTEEEPLFQANQIGKLGITNIRESLKDFDEYEKGVSTTDTLGGQQQTLFLTELGLYRLLGQSRKPVARPFQRWVGKVIKEIRITGKYELERQRNESCLLLEESKREAEEAKKEAEESKKEAEEAKKEAEESKKEAEESKREAEESKKEAEESNAVAGAKEAELAKIRTKIYEELPKLDHVYVSKEVVAPQWRLAIGQAELASDAHKVGKAVDPRKREAQLNTGSAQGARVIYTCATHNAKIIEDIVKVAQRRYHIASIGGCEHYNNAVEHSVDVIDIATTVVDTLASSFEYMKRGVLFRKVIGNLEDVWGVENEEDNEDKDKEKDKEKDKGKGKDKDPPAAIAGEANPLKDWLDTTVIVTGNSSDVLLIADLKGTCHIRDKRFAEYVEEYFRGVRGVTFHAVNSVKVGETWATKRGVLKGVQLQ